MIGWRSHLPESSRLWDLTSMINSNKRFCSEHVGSLNWWSHLYLVFHSFSYLTPNLANSYGDSPVSLIDHLSQKFMIGKGRRSYTGHFLCPLPAKDYNNNKLYWTYTRSVIKGKWWLGLFELNPHHLAIHLSLRIISTF